MSSRDEEPPAPPVPPPSPPPPSPRPPHPPTIDYEPWPQPRKLPKPVKIFLWVAVGLHAMGIVPAIAFLAYVLITDRQPGTLSNMMSSGTCCCYPAVAFVLIVFLILWIRAGGDDEP